MWYHLDLVRRQTMNGPEQFMALFGHNNDFGRRVDDLCMTSRWVGVGLASTVCSVVTTGISRRDKSSMMLPPASPPKIPYSC